MVRSSSQILVMRSQWPRLLSIRTEQAEPRPAKLCQGSPITWQIHLLSRASDKWEVTVASDTQESETLSTPVNASDCFSPEGREPVMNRREDGTEVCPVATAGIGRQSPVGQV